MQIKKIDSFTVPGGKAYALCDDDGKMIGPQVGCIIETHVGEMPKLVVTFAINEKDLKLP